MNRIRCEICDKTFTREQSYTRHLESDFHNKRKDKESMKYACECGKTYSYRQSFHVHIRQCNYIDANPKITMKQEIEEIQTKMSEQQKQFEEEREIMKRQIEDLMEKYENNSISTTNNNNTTNNNTTNIGTQNNVNIHINAFGKENLDYITDGVLNECANKVYASIPTLIENIHFNPKHPENHNIKITNKKLPHASVMTEDKEWKLMDKNELIDNMMDTGYMLIDDNFKDDPTQFTEERRRQYRRYQENYEKEDKETMKRIKSDVQYAILNGTKKIHSKEPNKNQYKA